MEAIARFFAEHRIMYVLAIVGAASFGLFAVVRAFREEARLAKARDLGLAAVAAGEVGGLIAMGRRLCEAEIEEPAQITVAAEPARPRAQP